MVDLKLQYQLHKSEFDAALTEAAAAASYILGPNVKSLEREIGSYCQCKEAAGVGNGTDALHLALRALRIGSGDEVITTAFTFVATTEAIGIVGAKTVFVDIDPRTFNIDPIAIDAAITSHTKAIIPVHLFGQPCQMDAIMSIAGGHGISVVEDCAQALGATFHGQKVGSFGDIGCLSFFPSKNLGCFGDGGMCVTNDGELFSRIEMLRRHGGKVKYHHSELGLNSRLDELQAAVLRVKFRYLEEWNEVRRQRAYRYNDLLGDIPSIVTPSEIPDVRAVYHQYTIRIPNRDRVQAKLGQAGVQSMIYYPIPLHLQAVHADLGCTRGMLPNSERAADSCLSLPLFPELTDQQQDHIANVLRDAIKQ